MIRYDPLNEEIEVSLIEDDIAREEASTIGYYAMFEYENGFRKTMYWSKKKMQAHADKYSAAYNSKIAEKIENGEIPENEMWKYSSFWYKDFDGMAMKTMLRQLISKWGIMSIDMQDAINKDMAVISDDGTPDYVDNQPEEEIQEVVSEQEVQEVRPVVENTESEPNHTDAESEFFDS